MNDLLSHIEFLLHEHNCVVVPDLGGFVVNVVSAHREGVSDFYAPVCELVFNRDLKHNDGLLAQSYMKTSTLSFEAATHKIEQEVQVLKKHLREQRHLELEKLGVFTMQDDEHFIYTPAIFIRPAFFGLSKASLKPLIQMPMPKLPLKRENERIGLRTISARVAAVVAIVLLTFIYPANDSNIKRQTAQMLPNMEKTTTTVTMPADEGNQEIQTGNEIVSASKEIEKISDNQIIEEIIIENQPAYYIVIGVFSYIEGANKTMDLLTATGDFSQAAKIERSGRFFVTAAFYSDRSAAEVELRKIHREYPAYNDAWILKR
jgi:nucleoid DNA-binding protein